MSFSKLITYRFIPLITVTVGTNILLKKAYTEDSLVGQKSIPSNSPIATRTEILKNLKNKQEFDLLIIGGGATGLGCALDATSRGLNVALVEREDFSSGTSSKSTKLIHGGVRYLEKAFTELDIEQYKLVREALHERGVMLKIAPHLTHQLPIMLPIYQTWKIPYFWAGVKAYDLLAGSKGLSNSYYLSRAKALEMFPLINDTDLCGAVVYYDGAQNDSRMAVSLAITGVQNGAQIANHVEVLSLIKTKNPDGTEKVTGAHVKDRLTSEVWDIKAKGVINATGPYTDSSDLIRKMEDPSVDSIVQPSSGVHLIFPEYLCPKNMGLIDPRTNDGRVFFVLPWENRTLVGTTDDPSSISFYPKATTSEIDWIVSEFNHVLKPEVQVTKKDILAAWSGIRPLVRDPSSKSTEGLVRNHMIHSTQSGLLTIAGGKWTTYRAMAQHTIDQAIKSFDLTPPSPCKTESISVFGAGTWTKNLYIDLTRKYNFSTEVAQHLSKSYGDQACKVAQLQANPKLLSPKHNYLESEVIYGCRNEYACTAVDVLAHRMRLAFIDVKEAYVVLPKVIEIMSKELNWSWARQRQEFKDAEIYLKTMGLDIV